MFVDVVCVFSCSVCSLMKCMFVNVTCLLMWCMFVYVVRACQCGVRSLI